MRAASVVPNHQLPEDTLMAMPSRLCSQQVKNTSGDIRTPPPPAACVLIPEVIAAIHPAGAVPVDALRQAAADLRVCGR